MKLKLTSIYVDDQDKALRFYTEVLGLTKKADFGNGGFRWLTVSSAEDPNGTELQLASADNPAGKAYQQAIYQQGQPALMLFTDDITGEVDKIKGKGGKLKMEPPDVTGSTIAQLDDGSG